MSLISDADWMQTLLRQYLAMIPMLSFQWTDENWTDNSDWQLSILKATLFHPVSIRFPPSTNYQRAFLKKLINKVKLDTFSGEHEKPNRHLTEQMI